MNWHVFERVTTKMGILSLVSAGGVALNNVIEALSKIPEQWWVVLWMAGMSYLMLKWQRDRGKEVPRTPNGEISRMQQALREEKREREREVERLQEELKTERSLRRRADERADGLAERLSRIEGDLQGLTVVVDGDDKG